MPDDKDKAVLATRVLSYLKRKFGDGPPPSAEETKAATAAVTLLSTAFPLEAKDPVKLFEKLKQVSRKNLSENSQMDQMRLQMEMQHQSQMYQMLSNIMKTKHETVKNTISNIR